MPVLSRAVPSVVLAAALLAGCTGDEPPPEVSPRAEEPASTPTVPGTPMATKQPSAAPEPPKELQQADEEGAAAAATYFLQLYSYTMATGDLSAWEAMSTDRCGFCARTREFALATRASNETFSGAEITPVSTYVHPMDTSAQAYPVDVEFTQAGAEHRDAEGNVLRISPPDSGVLGVDVTRAEDGWKVLAVTAQDSE